MPRYGQFKLRHPDYDEHQWHQCRAFYAGGKKLLGDKHILQRVFPKHLNEVSAVYKERMARAFYIPYPGEIIDSICAGLFGEPLRVESEGTPDPYYDIFFEDVSPPGGREQSLNELIKQQVLTALLCKRAWTLVDLPDMPPDNDMPETLLEQERMGMLDAYAVPIDPEMVLDWEENSEGELEWVMVLHKERKRAGINDDRGMVREEYTIYYPNRWERYVVTYHVSEVLGDDEEVPIDDEGPHSFGKVPLLRLELTDGLWAMGKILPIAIAHFNLRNALSWAEYKSLFPILTAYKQGMDPLNPVTEDQDRELNQVYGQGRIVGFAEKDRLEYVGPDAGPFSTAMQDLSNLRDEMHRVLHQMAMSVDNSAAALQRSADSKQVDQAATAVILRALGQYVRDHVTSVYSMVERGRDDTPNEWNVEGMEKFDEISVDSLITQAETVDTVSIPSAKFKQLWTFMFARRLLGDNVTEAELDEIKKELEANITNEQFEFGGGMESMLDKLDKKQGQQPPPDGGDNGQRPPKDEDDSLGPPQG